MTICLSWYDRVSRSNTMISPINRTFTELINRTLTRLKCSFETYHLYTHKRLESRGVSGSNLNRESDRSELNLVVWIGSKNWIRRPSVRILDLKLWTNLNRWHFEKLILLYFKIILFSFDINHIILLFFPLN